MKLSIIIPVYNECNTIGKLLSIVESVKIKYAEKEIIIVDDFSTDGTREKLLKLKIKKIKLLFHDKNRGKGAAIKTGLGQATGEIIIFQDADLEYDPNDYGKLIQPIVDGRADAVYGSRFLGKDRTFNRNYKKFLPFNYYGNKLLTLATNILYNSRLTDMDTCYTVFRSDVIKSLKLKSDGFEITPEITAKAFKKKIRIQEVPVNYSPRSHLAGKKLNFWKDGVKAFYCLLKYRFSN